MILVSVEGFISKQVPGVAQGAQPQHRQLVLVIEPTEPFGHSTGAGVDAAQETQWWKPGTPQQCKLANRVKSPRRVTRGKVVATSIIGVNVHDRARLEGLLETRILDTPARERARDWCRPYANT